MSVIDLAAALTRLSASDVPSDTRAGETRIIALAETPSTIRQLLLLAPGDRWEAAPGTDHERSALTLEGVATWEIGDTLQSLGPGHLAVADGRAHFAAVNDSPSRVVCLITRTRVLESV